MLVRYMLLDELGSFEKFRAGLAAEFALIFLFDMRLDSFGELANYDDLSNS